MLEKLIHHIYAFMLKIAKWKWQIYEMFNVYFSAMHLT